MQGRAGTGPKQAGCFAGASYGLSAPCPHGAELVLRESSARCALHPSCAALPLALMLWMDPLWGFFSLGIPQTSTTARGVMGMPTGCLCSHTRVHGHLRAQAGRCTQQFLLQPADITPLPNKLLGHPVHPNFLQHTPSAVIPPALLLLQPHRCASGCAKPYTLPLHPPSSVDAPHEDNPLGSPPRPKPAPEGDDVTLKKPSLTQQHPSLEERLPQPSHPAHTSPFVLFSCSH